MEIGVTKAVQDKTKIKLVEITKNMPLVFCWDTHLVKLKGRNVLLIVNASNRYTIATKTHGRKSVGGINRMVTCMEYYDKKLEKGVKYQWELCEYLKQGYLSTGRV